MGFAELRLGITGIETYNSLHPQHIICVCVTCLCTYVCFRRVYMYLVTQGGEQA